MWEDHTESRAFYSPCDGDEGDGDFSGDDFQTGPYERIRRQWRHKRSKADAKTWTLDEMKMLMMGRGGVNGQWSGSPPNATIVYKIGIYGWRKRCLYVFLLLMMVTIIVNLALTVWILKVMDFSIHGMGQLRMAENGVRVEGDSEFLQGLYTASVKSPTGAALTVESARNITLNARDKNNKLTNRLIIGNNKIESFAKKFEVRTPSGQLLYSADKDSVRLSASTLVVKDSGGATFTQSVQTPVVRSDADNLRLESPTRSVVVSAPEGVTVQAQSGPVYINSSLAPVNIESLSQITLEAKTVRLKSLSLSEPQIVDSPFREVNQLCICKDSGKLFMAPAQGNCQATGSICD